MFTSDTLEPLGGPWRFRPSAAVMPRHSNRRLVPWPSATKLVRPSSSSSERRPDRRSALRAEGGRRAETPPRPVLLVLLVLLWDPDDLAQDLDIEALALR